MKFLLLQHNIFWLVEVRWLSDHWHRLLHGKHLLRVWWDNLDWVKYFSDKQIFARQIIHQASGNIAPKRIAFRILEIVSLPFHKQFFLIPADLSPLSLAGATERLRSVQYILVVIQLNVLQLMCAKSSYFVWFPHTKWSGNLLEIIY